MEVKFRPTPQDLVDGSRAVKHPWWYGWLALLLICLLFLVGIFLIDHGFEIAGWLWLVVSVGIGIGLYRSPTLWARHRLKHDRLFQGEILLRFDEHGVESDMRMENRAWTGKGLQATRRIPSPFCCSLLSTTAL
jgi:hypothetical protein